MVKNSARQNQRITKRVKVSIPYPLLMQCNYNISTKQILKNKFNQDAQIKYWKKNKTTNE